MSFSLIGTALSGVSYASPKNYGTFSSTPDAKEIERQKQYQLPPGTAWETDTQGNTKSADYISVNGSGGSDQVSPMSWSDSTYTYVFDSYVQSSYKIDNKRFFVSKVSVENRSSQPLPLKYTQQETVTNSWSVSANISGEFDLGVKWLEALKISVGGSFSKSSITYSSTTVEAGPTNIPAGYGASYTKYRTGGYGAGQAAWKKYMKGTASQVGMYYTGESGWAPQDNMTTLVYAEWKLS